MMEPKWFRILLFTVTVRVVLMETEGWLEQERLALLQLKPFFNSPSALSDWVGSHCCQWEGVKCSSTSSRVIQLSLNYTRLDRNAAAYLNASMFLPFKELKSLYLVGNGIAGFVHNQGIAKLSSALKKLEVLDLSYNHLSDSILSSLSELSSLKYLSLEGNRFTGSDDRNGFKWLSRLCNLETLDLSDNHLKNNILLHVGNLSSLKSFNLAENQLKGSVNVKELRKLRSLDLSWNGIESFEDSGTQVIMDLEKLDLSGNLLNNTSFAFISRLSNLKSLSIGDNNLQGCIDIEELNKLAKLKHLELNGNQIESLRSYDESDRLLKLMNLEQLDLSSNLFNNSILRVISGLSNLKSLNIGNNQLEGSINIKELEAFQDLEELDFSYNKLYDFVAPKELENISTNVKELSLSYSHLGDNILQSIGAFTSLTSLTLSNTWLTGPLPTKGWCDLRNLKELDLSGNALVGSIPSCFSNLTSLRLLDISNNGIEIPSSFISFANNSLLEYLFVDQIHLVSEPTFQIPTKNSKLQLKLLSMRNTTKRLSKQLPSFLYYQYDLRYLDLSNNNFGGQSPSWLLENNTRLQQFFMADNSFTGPLQLPKHANPNMVEVDMSNNEMQGQVPMNICSTLPHLQRFSLSRNAFEGNIPPCLSGLKSLSSLDLSYNNFSGGKIEEFAKSNSLEILRLSSNNLSGEIPASLFSSIGGLYLDGNNFHGEIPNIDLSAINFLSLHDIDLSNNHLSGKLPRWIWNASRLDSLVLSENHFDGHIPLELCNLGWLRFLDLSWNNFSGSVPSCIGSLTIEHLHLNRNRLSGPLPQALYNSSSLVTLDLSQNNFTGKIPDWIGTLSALCVLLLKANHFEGEIPSQICRLNSLSIIDLSRNKLSGPIPSCLSNLSLVSRFGKSFRTGSTALGIRVLEDPKFDSMHWYPGSYVEEQVVFTTKKGLYTYSGNILDYMTGIDLSCNRLTGQIPPEIGNLSELHALNLSHNNLTGFIPSSFSKLKQIESLDLSYNKLGGIIPIQLMELNSLAVFNVSYNNLAGSIPHEKAQFATFDESSYLGNALLCGPPKHESCTGTGSTPISPNASGSEEESGLLDMHALYAAFWVCYVMVLMTIGAVLYINPHWRRVWFYFIGHCIDTCHYFIVDNVLELSLFKKSS
ncbi:receptor like protein 13 [Hibiscus trionum]|uniref:Receptor like protein 13 n=1 Tax=Hibiscus trionum TaxID=183268 RepID=A0A9W7J3J5_HIBTR|nr:receptor like protein 13 [Hibiscus trionum]